MPRGVSKSRTHNCYSSSPPPRRPSRRSQSPHRRIRRSSPLAKDDDDAAFRELFSRIAGQLSDDLVHEVLSFRELRLPFDDVQRRHALEEVAILLFAQPVEI